MGYVAIREAVTQRFLAHFQNELSETRCSVGDLDKVMDSILSEGASYGCIIFSDGGSEQRRQATDGRTPGRVSWFWDFVGSFIIRYSGDGIEEREAQIIDKLSQVFKADPRLGGTTSVARFTSIGAPQPSRVNDDVFDWIPFEFQVWEP